MGAYTGLRKGDVLKFPWSARDGGEIRQGKNDDSLWIPEHNEAEEISQKWATAGADVLLHSVLDSAEIVN